MRHQRILVVDDQRDVQHMSRVLFSAAGHEVQVAGTADEALGIAAWFQPELVFCDLRLPGTMDGCGLAPRLKNLGCLAQDGLCAITGCFEHATERAALSAGFDRLLHKPIDYAALIEELGRMSDDQPADRADRVSLPTPS